MPMDKTQRPLFGNNLFNFETAIDRPKVKFNMEHYQLKTYLLLQ